MIPATPPETRREWERLLRSLGFREVRTATHGTLWDRPGGARFMIPRLSGNAKRLDPHARKNLLANLKRTLTKEPAPCLP